jgi:hypothetical protein
MNSVSEFISVACAAIKKTVPLVPKISSGGRTITAVQLQTALGLFGSFFAQMQKAMQAKDFGSDVEIAVEDAVKIAADLGLGEPMTGIVSALLPYAFDELNKVAAMPLIAVDGGLGGFVTEDWVADPRHGLRPDGSFKNE